MHFTFPSCWSLATLLCRGFFHSLLPCCMFSLFRIPLWAILQYLAERGVSAWTMPNPAAASISPHDWWFFLLLCLQLSDKTFISWFRVIGHLSWLKGAMRIAELDVCWIVARPLDKLYKRKMISFPSPRRDYAPHHLKLLKTLIFFDMLVTCDSCTILLPLPTFQKHEVRSDTLKLVSYLQRAILTQSLLMSPMPRIPVPISVFQSFLNCWPQVHSCL